MQSIRNVIIAAAGMGNRLGYGIPKCLVEVLGKKIIEYQLDLLKDVPNVRIVVGYREKQVLEDIKKIRKDIIFVRNPSFKDTTTLQSLYLATKGLEDSCIIMDGDTIYERESFNQFMKACEDNVPTIGVTSYISDEPVYAQVCNDSQYVVGFSRDIESGFEWANLALIQPSMLANNNTHVYQQLSKYLPMRAIHVKRLEIDTEHDLQVAIKTLNEHPNYV
ncbi:NTP transferase domain-containing protein [Desulfuribacillus alkaliarsenatis]|uniref:MobA-like NTP transferase domain-containing protein n=1 Tax=Desulfuribacillus alkaliarsenatis TaxID=766136 RepID=A0A1E5G3Q4_9FIRM|nr:NTP transferase domain-containing protein [Desulfuribacillus alkaliarsenatis]OEF97721.1 hypothetical protein BHF68_14075 [Desulfuribacillus alkaliarsenatis]